MRIPFPNVVLRTQDDRPVRFYDDLIRDRIVVINMMYARCEGICPVMTTNLVRVQRLLAPRVGRDIFMYSITLKPEEDTPARLRAYAGMHRIGPGWTFLTGKPADVELVRRRMGFVDSDPAVDRDKAQHLGLLRIGNDAIGSWSACAAQAAPRQIVRVIRWMDVPGVATRRS
jgi:protein SCO1/2